MNPWPRQPAAARFSIDRSASLTLSDRIARDDVAGFVGRSVHTHQGERVVAGQLLMQASSDICLGWERVKGLDGIQRDFYVRQLREWKGSAEMDVMIP